MNNTQLEGNLRDIWRISDHDEVAFQNLVECVQAIHERVKVIEDRHNDEADARHVMDEAMEEQADIEHGPY